MTVLTLTLGILLLVGLLAALLAGWIGVPRVTLFIVAGLIAGPSVLDWIPKEHLEELDPVLKMALALVLLEIGSRFTLASFRRIMRSAVPLSAGELLCTFLVVAIGLWLIGEEPRAAVLLGGLALATAPATTIVVLREYDSEGPITAYTYMLVALNNLAGLVTLEVLFVLTSLLEGGADPDMAVRLSWLATDLLGSTAMGMVAGIAVSAVAAQVPDGLRALATLAVTTVVLGACESLNMPYLLAFLVMGVTLANASALAHDILGDLSPIAELLYVVFFVVAGAELNLPALFAAGAVGVVYVLTRCTGKYLGVFAAARLRHEPPAVRRWLGATLIAQAGAAIGMVRVAADRDPLLGAYLETIIVGTVVFFEIVGPLPTRLAVVRAGEVPIAHLVRPERTYWQQAWQTVMRQIRQSLGKDQWAGRSPDELTVGDLMRQNVGSLPDSADFLQVLDFIEHSRHQVYPVTSQLGPLVGVIRYADIRSILFDREVASLVRAEDLSVPDHPVLVPEQSIGEAFKVCETSEFDVIPVISPDDSRRLVGLIERRDVVRFARKRHKEASGG